ncbi:hypothetical protein DM860_013296 [Cuscuta australis]|uniref:Uncharacterized protein n=1 Tax=Cuscuta australis TaxID=267555 RepID=A0A328DT46_9ASTE|nr:hypothetical protein DM860_013296 [Cuscuta australis]
MELRKSSNSHFIQTIKKGFVVKTCNVNSRRKPVLIFRNMEEIHAAKDHSTLSSPEKFVKSDDQSSLPPVADRTLRETDSVNNNEIISYSSDGESDSDDCILVDMTLKQVKERCRSRKRKLLSLFYTDPAREVFKCEEVEDEDLNIPLSAFKTKLSNKSSKAKRGCPDLKTSCSETSISVKSEHMLDSDFNMELNGESASTLANVKEEVVEEEFSICQNTNSVPSFPIETPILLDEAHDLQFSVNQHVDSFNDCPSIKCDEEWRISSEVSENIEVQESMPIVFAEEQKCCTLNDVSTKDNLQCVEVDNSTDDHQADDIQMPEDEVQEEICSSQETGFASGDFEINSSYDDDLTSAADSTASSLTLIPDCSFVETGNTCLNALSVQGESLTPEENSPLDIIEELKGPTIETQPLHQNSSLPQQPPQRFPSFRTAISPSSQERLCLEMKSVDLFDELENDIKPLIGQEDVSGCTTYENSKLSSPGCQQKVIIRREQITRKLKRICRKGFPHKANSDGPLFSRSLPQLSTGSTSIDSCSNSAVAFSQRQMHDFEFLAMKLLDELKSMQGVVEENLLFKAYRSSCCKNDVDKVKTRINNTRKVEETARKWMSMMARDCTRFCKLMGMQKSSQDHSPSPESTAQRDRKITFADEAGGMLCTVNYFAYDDIASSPQCLPCEDEKQVFGQCEELEKLDSDL